MDDSEKKSALQQRAAGRGFTLDDTVARFIMSHYSRDTRALFSLLDKLDSESLQSQRKITVPFLKTLIGCVGYAVAMLFCKKAQRLK